MNLHDAIYTPRCEYNVRHRDQKTPIQNAIRRDQINREENIQILDMKELERITPQFYWRNRIQMPKPKPSLWKRFISLFK